MELDIGNVRRLVIPLKINDKATPEENLVRINNLVTPIVCLTLPV